MKKELERSDFTTNELGRAELAVDAFNAALDLLRYHDKSVPNFRFGRNARVDGIDIIGCLLLKGAIGMPKVPTVLAHIGENPAGRLDDVGEKSFDARTNVKELAATMFEEAFHYVDYKKKKFKPILVPGDTGYEDQPHEKRAAKFVADNTAAIECGFEKYVKFYE